MALSANDKIKIIRDIQNSPEDDGLVSYPNVISYCEEYAEQKPPEFGVTGFDKRIDPDTKKSLYYVEMNGKMLNVGKDEYLARLAIYLRNAATDFPSVQPVENVQ